MIRTEQISFGIGDFRMERFSLEIARGQYFVLLGPPGSGKTVFLECLCGLKRIGSGKIFIDGRNVTRLEPRVRNIGYVPQDYALFPHLSVKQNIAFGLLPHEMWWKVIRIAASLPPIWGLLRLIGIVAWVLAPALRRCEEVRERVARTAEILGISHLLDRNVGGLSGGEKQRTALARALVMEPKVLLLDEPVCALDEGTRHNVCALLSDVQRKLGLTVIHVSHNLEEAFSVADMAAILSQGALQQVGSLDELLRKPDNEFVARFMRCENIFAEGAALPVSGPHSGKPKMMIRPEDVLVLPPSAHDSNNANEFRVRLVRWRNYGGYVRVELAGPVDLVAHLTHPAFARLDAKHYDDCIAVIRPEDIHVFGE